MKFHHGTKKYGSDNTALWYIKLSCWKYWVHPVGLIPDIVSHQPTSLPATTWARSYVERGNIAPADSSSPKTRHLEFHQLVDGILSKFDNFPCVFIHRDFLVFLHPLRNTFTLLSIIFIFKQVVSYTCLQKPEQFNSKQSAVSSDTPEWEHMYTRKSDSQMRQLINESESVKLSEHERW